MSVALTPARLAACYDMLRAFPPFSRGLPNSRAVRFVVSTREDIRGEFLDDHRPVITISRTNHAHLDNILCTLAHEMIHLLLERAGRGGLVEHNAEFRRMAARVAKYFGWDEKAF